MSNTDLDDDFDPTNFIARQQRASMAYTLGSLQDDPEKAARAVELGNATGDKPPLIYNNLEDYEQQHKAALTASLLNSNKYLRQYVDADPMHAKISNDDYGNLDGVSEAVHKLSLTSAGRILRAPEAIGGSIFEGAWQGFRKGFGTEPSGSWITDKDLKEHKLGSAVAATLAMPIEGVLRFGTGLIEGAKEATKQGAKIGYQAFTGDEQGAEQFSRDLASMVEQYMMGTSGVHQPKFSEAAIKIKPIIDKAAPWLDESREPPRGLDPEIDKLKFEQNKLDLDNLDEAYKAAQSSATRERSPEVFASFIRQHTDASINISGDAIAKLYGDKVPEVGDNILGWAPRIAEELQTAVAIGGDVRIPLADWLAKVDPEVEKELHDFIKVRPGGITKAEKEIEARAKEEIEAVRESKSLKDRTDDLENERSGVSGELYNALDQAIKPVVSYVSENTKPAVEWAKANGRRDIAEVIVERAESALVKMKEEPSLEKDHPRYEKAKAGLIEAKQKQEEFVKDLREMIGPTESKLTSYKPPEIIPEPLPSVRGAAGLEPMFSIGDRKLTLEKREPGERTYKPLNPIHEFKMLDENGQSVGYVEVSLFRDGKDVHVDIIGGMEHLGFGPNAFGPALTRDIARQLKAEFPDSERVGGFRVSGAREKAGTTREVWIKFDQLDNAAVQDDLHKIFEGGQSFDMSHGVEAYYSPLLREHQVEADKAIREELARIVPKQTEVFTPNKITIPDKPGFTRRGMYSQFTDQNPWISIALDSPNDLLGVARHEAIHHLRQQGFFTEGEWSILERAARDNDWKSKYEINDRYRGLPEGQKLEEAIAEGYRFWKEGNEVSPSVHAVFEKLKAFFEDLKARLKEVFGREVTWEELFKKVDIGEIGAREGNAPTREGAFRQSAVDEPEPKPAFGKGAIMTVEQQKLYDKLIAQRHAEDLAAATTRAEAEQRKRQTKEWKDNAKEVRAQVNADIHERPDVAADLYFGARGKDRPRLGTQYLTREQEAALPKEYVSKDGINPDDIAGRFGYTTGDAMVDKLGEYNQAKLQANMSSKDFVARIVDLETERQMQAKFGNLENSILDEAINQATSETQLNILHEEILALGLKAGSEFPITKADLKTWVKDKFDQMPISSLDQHSYLAASGKAGREAEMALLKEDYQAAYRAKQQQFMAMQFATEAKKLEKEWSQLDRTAKAMGKRDIKNVDGEYLNHIQDLLQRVGYPLQRSIQNIAENIASKASKNVAEFANQMLNESMGLRDIPVADMLNDPAFRKPIADLTAWEFRGFKQTIDALVKNGRDELKIYRQGEAADLAEIQAKMQQQIETFPLKTYQATKGRWAKATDLPRSFLAGLTNMETIFNRFDRDDSRGVFNTYINHTLFRMANGESRMIREYSAPYRELGLEKVDMKKLVDAPFPDPLSKSDRPWSGFTYGNVLTMLQNAGNKSNLRVLAKGYGMEPEALMSWIEDHTTPEDWHRAQKMGDIFKSLIGHADGVYERINGITVDKIPLEPITNRHGTFAGWYHPLIKDPIRRGKIPERIGAYDDSDFGHITTANGYTKKRTGAVYPLDLTFDSVTNRMTQMIHDINFREGVLELQKVFKDPKFLDAITAHYGEHYSDLMKPYLESIAGAESVPSKAAAKAGQYSEFLRQNTISTYIGFNPSTAFKHGPTAWAFSARQVGLKPFLSAFYKTAAEAVGFKNAVQGLYGQSSELGVRNSAFAMKWSEELQRRERHWQDTFAGANKILQGAQTVREQMIQYGSMLVAKSDMLSAKPTWIAAYENATREGSTHGEAIDLADQKVRFAHGSTAKTNQPALVRGGGPIHGWLTSIYGFFGTDMQRKIETAHAINDAYQLGKEGEIRKAAALAPGIIADIMTYAIWPVIVEEVVSSQYSDDRRSGLTRLAMAGSTMMTNSVLYLRDMAYAFNTGHDPSVGLATSPLHDMANVARDLKKGRGAFSRQQAGKTVGHILTFAGDATGMAPKTLDSAIKFGIDLVNKQAHPKTAGDWWRGVTHGTTEKHVEY